MADDVARATCKMSEVPIGAHVRNPLFGTWQQVADVVRVRDGSGDIQLTFVDGGRFIAGPNEPIEIRATDEDVPADLMRTAELAAYEALKEDHREPTALWAALVHKAVAAVLPLHEQQVREQIAAELRAVMFRCPTHNGRLAFNDGCIGCQRYAALVGAERIVAGHESPSARAVREMRQAGTNGEADV